MLEAIKYHIHLPALFIVLGVGITIGALGLWGVHRTSGRPIREMLALLGAAFVIIVFMFSLVLVLDEWTHSHDLAIRELTKTVFYLIALPFAFVVWRFFNRLSRPRRKVNSDSRGHHYHEPIA
jgi:hypothetical protein